MKWNITANITALVRNAGSSFHKQFLEDLVGRSEVLQALREFRDDYHAFRHSLSEEQKLQQEFRMLSDSLVPPAQSSYGTYRTANKTYFTNTLTSFLGYLAEQGEHIIEKGSLRVAGAAGMAAFMAAIACADPNIHPASDTMGRGDMGGEQGNNGGDMAGDGHLPDTDGPGTDGKMKMPYQDGGDGNMPYDGSDGSTSDGDGGSGGNADGSPDADVASPCEHPDLDLVHIPTREFYRGCEFGRPGTSCSSSELPSDEVLVNAYCIQQTEMTHAQFNAYAAAAGVERSPDYTGVNDNHPVTSVNWETAQAACAFYGGRLPTEAEWENAARGPAEIEDPDNPGETINNRRLYPYGDSTPVPCEEANYGRCFEIDGTPSTAPVGSYPAGRSYDGLDDMAGNVGEWINDWFGQTYYASPGSDDNPQGPAEGTERVVRGGEYFTNMVSVGRLQTFTRLRLEPSLVNLGLGFRCSKDIP